jgi:hypothetical protein
LMKHSRLTCSCSLSKVSWLPRGRPAPTPHLNTGSIASSSFAATSTSYCMELFWGQYGGDWEAMYDRWSTTLGIPDTDMNAWADTCPGLPGYDELGNYMTYSTPVCFAALGHFTAAQAQRVHYVTAELNPVMYAWGQHYFRNAAPPPPLASPPPENYNNTCRVGNRLGHVHARPGQSNWHSAARPPERPLVRLREDREAWLVCSSLCGMKRRSDVV